jgi:hypothetical protein
VKPVKAGAPCPQQSTPEISALKQTVLRTMKAQSSTLWSGGVSKDYNAKGMIALTVNTEGKVSGVSATYRWKDDEGNRSKSFGSGALDLDGLKGEFIGYTPQAACVIYVYHNLPSAK